MKSFAKTWWGEQWLNALESVDYSNRLPRGRTYARNGAVLEINFKNNIIEAKVAGSKSKPYDIKIIIPPFFDNEKKILTKHIAKDNILISKLFARELPTEILDITQANHIKLFPESWQDLKLICSCPDWAVPCKHLAAVIYMIASEIDKNPFIIFEMHQYDVFEELKRINIQATHLKKEKIFSIHDCYYKESYPNYSLLNVSESEFAQLDYTTLPDQHELIINLFPDKCLFYQGNFKKILSSWYNVLSKKYKLAEFELCNNFDVISDKKKLYSSFKILVTPIDVYFFIESNKKHIPITAEELINTIVNTEVKHLENYSIEYQFLFHLYQFLQVLLQKGAIVPKIFKVSEDAYRILWIPVLMNDKVNKLYNQFVQLLPDDIIEISTKVTKSKSKKLISEYSGNSIKKYEVLKLIIADFINHLMKYSNLKIPNTSQEIDKKVQLLFFEQQIVDFTDYNEKEIPSTIQRWLNRFELNEREIIPVIAVEELYENYFKVNLQVELHDTLSEIISIKHFFEIFPSDKKMTFIKDLNLLIEFFPDLNKILKSEGNEDLVYNCESFVDILLKILPIFNFLGIKVLLPKSLQNLLRPNVSIQIKSNNKTRSYITLTDILDFDWMIAVGDEIMDKERFIQLVNKAGKLIKVKEHYVLVNKNEAEKILKYLENPPKISQIELLRMAIGEEFHNEAKVFIDNEVKEKIQELLKINETPLPACLQAQLRSYQMRGYAWLYKNFKLGFGSILADDMGLGKTLQTITLLAKLKEEGVFDMHPGLVIVPTSLITNWHKEIQRFAPHLTVNVFHGNSRKFITKSYDLIITSYGIIRTQKSYFEKYTWPVIIIDEGQNIKNPQVAQTITIKKLKANYKLALTGTPVENRLSEYWSLFDFTNLGYLGNLNWFIENFSKPIELYHDKKRLEKFKKLTAPFILRREKSDKSIIQDLPQKIENNLFTTLTQEQVALYEGLTKTLIESIEEAEGISRKGLILKLLSNLKQICNHPAQYLKNNNYSPELSGKALLLLDILSNIYEQNEKVLIFSQYKQMGNILVEILEKKFEKPILQLHGEMSRSQRDQVINLFQQSKQFDTLILSAATHVIHYDLWWNPAVENQATDRAYRIGQQNNVMIYRMITKGTLEEKIDDMIRSKKELANLSAR
ncbi:MAG: SNF2-related protein [Candidatus Pacearchaeota archaeon]